MALAPKVQATRDVVYRPRTPVKVSFDGTNKAVCTDAGTTSTIEFVRDAGDLPPMWLSDKASLKSTVSSGVDVHFVTTQKLNCSSCWTPGDAVRSGECGGHFTLAYDGHHTDELDFEANAAAIKAELVKLPGLSASVVEVTPTVASGSSGDQMCERLPGGRGGSGMTVKFKMNAGNQPPLQVTSSLTVNGYRTSGGGITVHTSDGTSEDVCNGGGTCNYDTGVCECDEFRTLDPDRGVCGAELIASSAWAGVERCAGYVNSTTLEVLKNGEALS